MAQREGAFIEGGEIMTSNSIDSIESPSATTAKANEANQSGRMSRDEIQRLIEERRNSVDGDAAISANSANSTLGGLAPAVEAEDMSWPEPQLFYEKDEPEPFPVNSLPPILRDAVIEVQSVVQAPMAMVASSALCTSAAACQALIDVRIEGYLERPVSLFFLILGDSGERKSTVDSRFAEPLKQFDREAKKESKERRKSYKAAFTAWKAKCDAAESAIKSLSAGRKVGKSGDGKSLADWEEELAKLHQEEPESPLYPKILVSDITQEKLVQQLSEEWPSCALMSAEGGLVFGSRSLSKENQQQALSTFDSLWSGETVDSRRKTVQSYDTEGARLSIGIFVQPKVFFDFCEKNDIARHVGFLGRCLIAYPQSTQGTRLYKSLPQALPKLERLHGKISALLAIEPPMDGKRLMPETVSLSQEAREVWIESYNQIERELAPGGLYEKIRDFGSKAPENIARVAAVFQALDDGPIVEVSADNLRRASEVVEWYLSEAVRLFHGSVDFSAGVEKDAKELLDWMCAWAHSKHTNEVSTADLGNRGPNRLRLEARRSRAIELLLERSCIRRESNRSAYAINPKLLDGELGHG